MGAKAGKVSNANRRRTRSSTAAAAAAEAELHDEQQKSELQELENGSPRKRARLNEESEGMSKEKLLARAIEAMHEPQERITDSNSASTSRGGVAEEAPASAEVLVTIPAAKVHLVEEQGPTVLLASGEFTITRIVHNGGVVAVFARVGEQQWPLAKDSPALKLSETYYVFSLRVPLSLDEDDQEVEAAGELEIKEEILNYGLLFQADGVNPELLRELDRVLSSYTNFVPVPALKDVEESVEDTLVGEDGSGPRETKRELPRKSDYYSKQLAPSVEYNSALARAIASSSGQLINGILWVSELIATQIERSGFFMQQHITPKRRPAKISPKSMKNVRSAKRVSKMTEEIAAGMLSGVITATGTITSSVLRSKAGAKLFGMLPGEAALATFDAFVRVFDALELAGKNVMSRTSLVTCQIVSHRYGDEAAALTKEGLSTAGHVVSTAWTISKIRTAIDPTKASKSPVFIKSAAAAAAEELKDKKQS